MLFTRGPVPAADTTVDLPAQTVRALTGWDVFLGGTGDCRRLASTFQDYLDAGFSFREIAKELHRAHPSVMEVGISHTTVSRLAHLLEELRMLTIPEARKRKKPSRNAS